MWQHRPTNLLLSACPCSTLKPFLADQGPEAAYINYMLPKLENWQVGLRVWGSGLVWVGELRYLGWAMTWFAVCDLGCAYGRTGQETGSAFAFPFSLCPPAAISSFSWC